MLVSAFVDQIVGHVDNTSPLDADAADRRLRIIEWLQETVNDIRSRKAFPWKRKTASLSVPVAGYVVVPTDFAEVGHNGGVYLTSTGERLTWVSEQELMERRQLPIGSGLPEVYSLFGADGTTGLLLLQLPPISGTTAVVLDYETAPVTLGESDDLALSIPLRYHQQVLIPFVRALAYGSKGDAREDGERARGERAYVRMAIQERRGKESTQQLRSFFGSYR